MTARTERREPVRVAGWWTVAEKELTDHIVSARFVVLLLILGLAAATTVYVASGVIRNAATQATGVPSIFLALFTITDQSPSNQIPQFYVLVGFLIPLVRIASGFPAIHGERSGRTTPRLPAHRGGWQGGRAISRRAGGL